MGVQYAPVHRVQLQSSQPLQSSCAEGVAPRGSEPLPVQVAVDPVLHHGPHLHQGRPLSEQGPDLPHLPGSHVALGDEIGPEQVGQDLG